MRPETDGPAPVEIFRSHSSVEVEIVRGLLAAHDIASAVASAGLAVGVFPLGFGHVEYRVTVGSDQADAAREVIAGHLDETAAVEVRRLSQTLGPLESRLGYTFRDKGLLEHALTHRSRAHEDTSGGVMDNESLEFLGDAVLGFVVAHMLFTRFPMHDEGYKSKVKAGLVSAPTLGRLAETLDLGRYVLLGRGEEKSGGRRKPAILADSLEAVIAAVYLDGGIEGARDLIVSWFGPLIVAAGEQGADATFTADWKSALQEWMQARAEPLPIYRVAAVAGPDHHKEFDVEVLAGPHVLGRATGRSKKHAEQEAARVALARLRESGLPQVPPASADDAD